jgi:D-xylose 1-dehydrogenase (NADP+, D-xylono-1,5-lactone-forming)
MRLRWGLLSTASINDVILQSCRDSAATEFVAVASRSLEKARAYAQARGIPRAWGSYEDLLADSDVDAVYVSLPNGLHMQWSLAALGAGKHVFCEKPLTRNAAEIVEVYEAAQRAGRVFGEAFMYRHHPQTDLIRNIAASGELGEMRFILSSHSFTMPPEEYGSRLGVKLDAGSLMDLGCYQIGMSRLLAGEPEKVYGEQILHDTGVDMRFAGTMRFPSGVIAQFDCAMDAPLRNSLEIVGTDGTLVVTEPWHCRDGAVRLRRAEETREIEVPSGDPYRLEFEVFARAVAGKHVAAFDRDEAVAQARAIMAFYESAASGHAVTVAR